MSIVKLPSVEVPGSPAGQSEGGGNGFLIFAGIAIAAGLIWYFGFRKKPEPPSPPKEEKPKV